MKKYSILLFACLFISIGVFAQTETKYSVKCMAFTPNGKKMVTGGEDGLVCIWNEDGKLTREIVIDALDYYGKDKSSVTQLAISPDGKVVAAKLNNYHVYLYSTDGTLISDIKLDNVCSNSDLSFVNNTTALMIVHDCFVRVDYDLTGKKVGELNFRPESDLDWDDRHDPTYFGSAILRNGNFIVAYSLKMSKKKDIYEYYIAEYDTTKKLVRSTKLDLNESLRNLVFSSRNDDIAMLYAKTWAPKEGYLYDCIIYDATNATTQKVPEIKGVDWFKLNPDGNNLVASTSSEIKIFALPLKETMSFKKGYYDKSPDREFYTPNFHRIIVTYKDKLPEIYALQSELLYTFDNSKLVEDNYIFEPERLLADRNNKNDDGSMSKQNFKEVFNDNLDVKIDRQNPDFPYTWKFRGEETADLQVENGNTYLEMFNANFNAEIDFYLPSYSYVKDAYVSFKFWMRDVPEDKKGRWEHYIVKAFNDGFVQIIHYKNGKETVIEGKQLFDYKYKDYRYDRMIVTTTEDGSIDCQLFDEKNKYSGYKIGTKVNIINNEKPFFIYVGGYDESLYSLKLHGGNIVKKLVAVKPPKDNSKNLVAYTRKVKENTITVDSGIVNISKRVSKVKDMLGMTLQNGHNYQITSLATSPDGKLLASGSGDMTVKIWNRNGSILHTLNCNGPVTTVRFSPDGKYLAVAADNVELWTTTGKHLRTIKALGVSDMSFSPNGTILALACEDCSVILCNSSSTTLKVFKTNTQVISSISFSPDGRLLAIGNLGKQLKIFDLVGNEVKSIETGLTEVNDLKYSPNGSFLSCSGKGELKIWDSNGSLIKNLKGFRNYKGDSNKELANNLATILREQKEHTMDISSDSKYVVVAGYDGGNKTWIYSIPDSSYSATIASKAGVQDVIFSADGKSVFLGYSNGSIEEFDLRGNSKQKYLGTYTSLNKLSVLPDNSILTVSSDVITQWSAEGKLMQNNPLKDEKIDGYAISPDGKTIALSVLAKIVFWDTKGNVIKVIPTDSLQSKNIAYSVDGQFLVTAGMGGKVKVFKGDGTPVIAFRDQDERELKGIALSNDGKLIATSSMSNTINLWTQNGSMLKTFNSAKAIHQTDTTISGFNNEYAVSSKTGPVIIPRLLPVAISPDKQLVAGFFRDRHLRIWKVDGTSVADINPETSQDLPLCITFSPDNKKIAIGNNDKSVLIRNADGTLYKRLLGHNSIIVSVAFSNDGKLLYSASQDGSVRTWDVETGNCVVYYAKGNDYINYTVDGYWDGSKDCGGLVPMVKGSSIYGVDQFATKYNRPDIVLQRINQGAPELLAHYKNQYKKRIRKLGFTEEQITGDVHLPVAQILTSQVDGKFIDLKFNLKDSLYNLKRFNVFINNVPLFGALGKPIGGQTASISERVELTSGKNKIEVSCTNEKSAESYRALTFADYTSETKSDLYILAFGVSKYSNSSYNLAYADKDAKDLTTTIEGLKGKGYDNVYTKILTNEQVTPDAIKSAKEFVKNAKPDDTFILFIAGHGMHDKDAEATYYFLTSNADMNNLKGTAADFETIEDLLQGIPPRNKLFLMDACESGEIDEEDQGQMIASATGAGIASRGFKSTSSQSLNQPISQSPKRSYLYQKDRYIYNDLVRRSGAIVFSSSKGGELSYERSDIENGLFTEYIMKALTTTEADKDGNGTVSTDELREYVSVQVAKSSGDLQHPTVDRDNIYQKFGFTLR